MCVCWLLLTLVCFQVVKEYNVLANTSLLGNQQYDRYICVHVCVCVHNGCVCGCAQWLCVWVCVCACERERERGEGEGEEKLITVEVGSEAFPTCVGLKVELNLTKTQTDDFMVQAAGRFNNYQWKHILVCLWSGAK